MSSSILLLSAALAVGADPIMVSGSGGCSGCGAAPVYSAPAVSYAPSVSYAAPSVSYSAAACDPCGHGGRVGLIDRLRARFARPVASASCGGCGAAPVISAPVFSAPVAACNSCGRTGLLSRLKAKFASFGQGCSGGCGSPMAVSGYAAASCGCSGGGTGTSWVSADPAWSGMAMASPVYSGPAFPAVGGCAPSVGTIMPAPAAAAPPQVMPNPVTEPKKEEPKKEEPKKEEPKKLDTVSKPAPVITPAPALTTSPLPAVDVPPLPTLGGTTGKY